MLRLSRTEVQARSALAQRVRGIAFEWLGRPWRLSLAPDGLAAPADTAWRMHLRWGGAGFDLAWPSASLVAWIANRFPGLDLPRLPPAHLAALAESATASLLASLAALGRGPALLERLWQGPAQEAQPPHRFLLTLSGGGQSMLGSLATDSFGLMFLAGLAARLPAVPNDLARGALPLRLFVTCGHARLPAGEVAALQPGDSILLDDVAAGPDALVWVGHAGAGLRARLAGDGSGGLVVASPFEVRATGGQAMDMTDHEDMSDDGQPVGLGQVPLTLSFDLGSLVLTLDELQRLQVGQPLDLGRPLAQAVSIRVNGALVGTGDLVEIDGRIGVTIQTLGAMSLPSGAVAADDVDEDGEDGGDGEVHDPALAREVSAP